MSTWVATAGARLGERYELEAKVGEGGMGEVWRAKHLALENNVAIKFLSGSLAANEETKKRFLMEAKLTAQLRSRHAVQVFDFGLTDDGQPYLVMELLHGEPLGERIERERHLSLHDVAAFMGDAAKALHRAHALGIVHRDFKPDNVFLTKGEDRDVEVKVVDFGIAKLIGSLEEARPSMTDLAEITGKALSQLTRTGKLVGTPHYMSPEQVRMSAEVGPAADIWAFGVVAFEALTGECPFDGGSVIELFSKIQLGKARDARSLNPDIPEAFDDWFKVACAVDPSLRFPDAQIAATLLADALGVTVKRVPIADTSSPKISLTSSPEISVVSSTDALSRSPSKNTLLSSATDHESVPKKSRTALWGATASLLVVIGAIGAVKYNSAHAAAPASPYVQHGAVTSPVRADVTASAAPSAMTLPVLPAASASSAVAIEAASDSANMPANSNKNTGKIHASHGAHGAHGSATGPSDPPPTTAAPSAQPAQPAPTASGPASPFSLPPLGL
ncbi:MAG: protein kinase [Polyangiaceae bacterium]